MVSPRRAGRGGDWLPGVVSRRGQSRRRGSAARLRCSRCRRGCSAGAAERARAGATAASAAVHRAQLARRGLQEAAGRGGRASGARGGGGGGEVMLAPGIRAAAAENKHLRDPGCSVPLARGPAERPETVPPAGKVRLLRWLCDLRVLTRRLAARASGQGCLGPGQRVLCLARLLLLPVRLQLLPSGLGSDRL